jgi:acetate kinase
VAQHAVINGFDEPLLVLNLGSATIKAALLEAGEEPVETRPMRRAQLPLPPGPKSMQDVPARIAEALGLAEAPHAVAHRIVHGGDAKAARILAAAETARLAALAALAPLHQRPALELVQAAARAWPSARQYGAFDTVWHAQLPATSRRLPVPASWDRLGVRRYGFHGLAFASAMRLLARQSPDCTQGRVVLAHLGGGSSVCAVNAGRSVDTSMTLTPLDGLPMATRSGSLDPGAVLFLMREHGLAAEDIEHTLYFESGLRGLSGLSGDVRELLAAAGNPQAALALEIYVLRVAQGVAAMAVTMGGIDHLVFTGGVGFHAAAIREAVVERLACLGTVRTWWLEIDEEREIAIACEAPKLSG